MQYTTRSRFIHFRLFGQDRLIPGPEVDQFFCEMFFVTGAPTTSSSSPRAPIELTTELTDMEDGTYDLTYTVPIEGQYELAVKLFDTHIKGSPFKVRTK